MSAPHGWPSAPVSGSALARRCATPARHDGERESRGWGDPSERTRVLSWLNEGLRPGRPGRLEREYPQLFATDSRAVAITCFEGSDPVAFCILWPTRFELARGTLGVGLISLVYTDPFHRGRGLARRVVRRAVSEAAAQGLGLCLLWSDAALSDFYRSQGFTRAGRETLLAIDRRTVTSALSAKQGATLQCDAVERIEPAQEADWPAILALRARRICHASIGEGARSWLEIPDLEVRVARTSSGIAGFAMRGRGDDFAGVIHEWGGDPDAILRCCESLLPQETADGGLLLLAPRETCPLTWRLRSAGARVARSSLAWFQVACAAALGRDLSSILPELAALELSSLENTAEGLPRLRITNRTTSTHLDVDAEQWLVSLFGDADRGESERARTRASGVLPESARSKLPLPLFVWGLESI